MKKIAAFAIVISSLLAVGCTKTDLPPENYDPEQWMQTHQRAEVAYTDYFSGNYIVHTSQGFAVVENWSGRIPRDFDILYAHFHFTGMQTIYNRSGNYFTSGRIVANWLTWGEAWNILDQISRQ
jgi:outer membrane biogenesis lipoprotein LolB